MNNFGRLGELGGIQGLPLLSGAWPWGDRVGGGETQGLSEILKGREWVGLYMKGELKGGSFTLSRIG